MILHLIIVTEWLTLVLRKCSHLFFRDGGSFGEAWGWSEGHCIYSAGLRLPRAGFNLEARSRLFSNALLSFEDTFN